tara:strand:- start:130 stop:315 length:186 start_codon:yes stop_codon:yes gene_type:complete
MNTIFKKSEIQEKNNTLLIIVILLLIILSIFILLKFENLIGIIIGFGCILIAGVISIVFIV